MQPDFWHQRWTEGRIGFHQAGVTPLLEQHWPSLALPVGSCVFVPLAGKSNDMAWLATRGHRVLGVELSQLAVEQFFEEHELIPEMEDSRHGTHYRAEGIELICGDAFALDDAVLADCTAVFDRAALIALPPELRQRYARELYARLPTGCAGLLVTLEYPQHEKDGPPFSVPADEVQALFAPNWHVDELDRRVLAPTHPGYVEGVTSLHAVAHRLKRR